MRLPRRRPRIELVITPRKMQLCGCCPSELVQPVVWSEGSTSSWDVELRCPECEHREQGVFSQGEVDGYDRHLDEGMNRLLDDLRDLTRENMEAEAQAFRAALAANVILPEDF
jgi:hypothetical protein